MDPIIVTSLVALAVSLVGKIIWDWLKERKNVNNDNEKINDNGKINNKNDDYKHLREDIRKLFDKFDSLENKLLENYVKKYDFDKLADEVKIVRDMSRDNIKDIEILKNKGCK